MNKFVCFLTGGHKFADKNLHTTIDDKYDVMIIRNHCIKCGKEYRCALDIDKVIKKDIRRKLRISYTDKDKLISDINRRAKQ